MEYDKVLIMKDGQVVEYDNPHHLLSDEKSEFYELAKQSKII